MKPRWERIASGHVFRDCSSLGFIPKGGRPERDPRSQDVSQAARHPPRLDPDNAGHHEEGLSLVLKLISTPRGHTC